MKVYILIFLLALVLTDVTIAAKNRKNKSSSKVNLHFELESSKYILQNDSKINDFFNSKIAGWLKSGAPGQPCNNNTDCWYGACGLITAAPTAPYLCCPSEATVNFSGNAYCTGMAPGNECYIDAMCGSYECEGCDYGQKLGICC